MHAHCHACLIAVLLAACTSATQAPHGEPQNVAVPAETVKPAETPPVPLPEPATQAPQPALAAVPPVAPDAASPTDSKAPPVPKTDRPPAAPATKPAVPSTAAPQSPPTLVAAPAKPPAPPLDLKSLETRLKETKAIGVFTKLTVKNQVDDLLDAFRAYYKGQAKSTLADLRRAYDLLVLKVIALLQDADPPLASAIAASREAIWGILSDRTKFANV